MISYIPLTIPAKLMCLTLLLHAAAAVPVGHVQIIDKLLNQCLAHFSLDMCNFLRDVSEHCVIPMYYRYQFRFVEIADLLVV